MKQIQEFLKQKENEINLIQTIIQFFLIIFYFIPFLNLSSIKFFTKYSNFAFYISSWYELILFIKSFINDNLINLNKIFLNPFLHLSLTLGMLSEYHCYSILLTLLLFKY